jgi:ferric enterobactin receptor
VYENPRNMVKASSGNLTIIQHIPSLRLIFNLVVELNFLSYSYRIAPNLYPFAYYDNQGEYHAIPEENRTDPEYENLKLPESTYNYYPSPFYTNYHLQVRKETKSGHSFSFYANNCFWYNPIYIRNEVRSRLNSSISFGFGVAFRLFN